MTTDQLTQINAFLSKTITPREFACCVRRLQDYAVRKALSSKEGDGSYINDGHFWLNTFLEILDPKLKE